MLCVFSAVSGEALASLDVEASEAEHQVRRLKARLAKQLGVSRFRQKPGESEEKETQRMEVLYIDPQFDPLAKGSKRPTPREGAFPVSLHTHMTYSSSIFFFTFFAWNTRGLAPGLDHVLVT